MPWLQALLELTAASCASAAAWPVCSRYNRSEDGVPSHGRGRLGSSTVRTKQLVTGLLLAFCIAVSSPKAAAESRTTAAMRSLSNEECRQE